MNWLAHLFLSEPAPAFRVGSLLPDLLRAPDLRNLPPDAQRGIERHHRIDAFTDSHRTVRRSIERIGPPHRRFAGILVDVFYDHFLTLDWPRYSPLPLEEFAAHVYHSLEIAGPWVPRAAMFRLRRMQKTNLLCSYGTVAGVGLALARISARFQRAIDLSPAVAELQSHYGALHDDFTAFFPELQQHLSDATP